MDGALNLSFGSDLKKSFVKKQACFGQLTDNEIEALADLLVEKKFNAGETIVTEGDLVDEVFLIVSGQADVRLITLKDHLIHAKSIATLSVGDAIGLNESGFYSLSGRRTATVVAMTDMVTLQLSVAKFHGFALAYPHVNEVMRRGAAAMFTAPK
ncbi:MAG: hypothetical protein K0S63_1085 [Gammaproteobacteria bacterium]|jgi:CRP-like cAMP-binding protein|nr:hypothetical protein [Gammaproteobacteria bacterium]